MANGKIRHSEFANYLNKMSRNKNATFLFEHVVHRARWYAMAFEVDKSYLLEPVYNFICRFPLL